jgi:hypothetical protein
VNFERKRDVAALHSPKIDSLNWEAFALSSRLTKQANALTAGKNPARIQT